jgi:ribosomal protein S18 acetylase RimI-like enzyme
MDILSASILDLGPLRAIERACFDRDAWPLLDLMAVLTFPDVIRLKAVENGRMVGFIAGDTREQGMSWIATIAVLPEYQNQGVGRALLDACESKLTAARVRLCLRTDNLSALRLYERQGYQRVDLWRGYYKDRADALVMEKLRGV